MYGNNRGIRHPKNYHSLQPQEQQDLPFKSGMTCEQKFNSITENVMLSLSNKKVENDKGCTMHPKLSKKCRKCL